jgi:aldehyde:ferredoxin oxidoreductase
MPVGGLTVAVGRKPEFFLKTAKKMGFPDEALPRIFDAERFDLGRFQAHYENWCTVINCLGICFRMQCTRLYDQDVCAALYQTATSMPMTPDDLMEGAERAYVLYRMLNAREGFSRADDRFPPHWFRPLKSGESTIELMDYFKTKPISREDAEGILDAYYSEKGWGVADGVPSADTLQRLGLETEVTA